MTFNAGIEAAAYLPFDIPRWQQYEHRIRRLMTDLGMPNSLSLAEAMKQLIRDVEHIDKNTRPSSSAPVEQREAVARIIDPDVFREQHVGEYINISATMRSRKPTPSYPSPAHLGMRCWRKVQATSYP